MATEVRNLEGLKVDAVLGELNKLRLDMLRLQAGVVYHADPRAAVASADATGLASAITLANALKAAHNGDLASACSATTGQGHHRAADATNLVTADDATDEASAITLVNEIKAKHNAHCGNTAAHSNADTTNTIATADATDEASAITLVNEIKAKRNAHVAAALNSVALQVVDP